MLSGLTSFVSDSPVTYFIVLGAVAIDAVFPLIPAETILITAAILAVKGDLIVWLLIPAAALGGIIGDSTSYALGDVVGEPAAERLFRGDKGQRRLAWARRVVDRYGGWLVLAARFVPGGRTAATFAAGTMNLAWRRRFLPADAVGAGAWATYITLLGYFGGEAFKNRIWIGILVSLGIAGLISVSIEGMRRLRRRNKRRMDDQRLEASSEDERG